MGSSIWKMGAKTRRHSLRDLEFKVAASAAPTSAAVTVANGTNGSLTFTSLKGSAVGNATSVTFTMSTNAAAVSLSGYDISIGIHSADTNASNVDTTASNVKTLMDANTNIAALVTTTTNVAGIMATKTKTLLAGGDDKLTTTSSPSIGPAVTFARNFKGNYTLTLTDSQDYVFDYAGGFVDVSSKTATSSGSGVCKVEVVPTTNTAISTFTVQMFDYTGALTDVGGASVIHGHLLGQREACVVDSSLVSG